MSSTINSGSLDSVGWDARKQILMASTAVFCSVLWFTGNVLLALFFVLIVLLPFPWILIQFPSLQRKLLFHSWYYKADKPLNNPALWGLNDAINKPIGPLGCWYIPSTCRCATSTLCKCLCDTVVIYCHGSSGSRGNAYRVDLVNYLASLGCGVYTFDYRGYADSPGSSSQINSVQDAKQVLAFARAAHPGKRFVLYGHSMGTGVVCQTAYQLLHEGSPIDSIILEAPFLSIPDVVLKSPVIRFVNSLSLYKDFVWKLSDVFPTKDVIGELSNVLMLFAENDEVIPVQHVLELQKLNPDSTLHLIPEGGHNFLIHQDSVKKAIEKHLKFKD